jgi:DNA invertase Pin-like site-specific DNA recombinase
VNEATRVAIYARMSTDKQSADSPADQIAHCRRYASDRGWHVVEELVIEEAGKSGASRHNRPGLLALIGRARDFDVLLCWDSSRLARNTEDLGWIRNRLRVNRCKGIEVSTGLDLANVGSKVMGVLNEEALVKLSAETHRGLMGRVERKLSAGGLPYGYRSVPIPSSQLDPRGNPVPAGYRWEPDPEKAAVVVRIFELYARGEGLRRIAHLLNAEGVAPPRPRRNRSRGTKSASWSVSSLQAMLQNPIYRGELIWNRSEWIKDHETGRRRRHERPESEWVRQHDEAWRIVSDDLWGRAQEVRHAKRIGQPRKGSGTLCGQRSGCRSGRARHLLGGLLECRECGGGFFAVTRGTHYGCGWHRDRGPEVCASSLRVPRAAVEERVLGAIRDRVLTPENVAYATRKAMEILRERVRPTHGQHAGQMRLREIEVEIQNAIRLAARLGNVEEVSRFIGDLEQERDAIRPKLSVEPIVVDLDAMKPVIEERVSDLHATLSAEPEKGRAALLALLGDRRIKVSADAELDFRVEGVLELSLETKAAQPPPGNRATRIGGSGGSKRACSTTLYVPLAA